VRHPQSFQAFLLFFLLPFFVGLQFWAGGSAAQTAAEDARQADFFAQQVEPILRKNCYECHSHQSTPLEGGLALDWKSGWVQGGDRGPAIVPGNPAESLLIKAVSHQDESLQMPEQKLNEQDLAVLVQWVRAGAWDNREVKPVDGDSRNWWSLRPLLNSPVPTVAIGQSTQDSSANPIDAFIAARLAESGLRRSARAEPRELLRRLYYDLIGLPPTAEAVDDFSKDPSQPAYEAIVDQLLASPRYGERWARYWMDTIHFAESHGYEHDVGRDNAWPYRDYLINVLNRDIDWSTFIRQQLAVDYFDPSATDLIPALGFLGAGTYDHSTYSTGPVTFDYMDRDDLLNQTMAAFTSTTANCARCHSHKFDPIPQEDYYALQAVFSGVLKGDITFDSDPATHTERKRLTALNEAAKSRDASLLLHPARNDVLQPWLQGKLNSAVWAELKPNSFISANGATLTRGQDGVILASGVNPNVDTYTLTASRAKGSVLSALRLDVFPHESLPAQGPGRCQNGNLHLSEISIVVFESDSSAGTELKVVRATADFNQVGWGIQRAIDGDDTTAWGIHPQVGMPHYAILELAEPYKFSSDSQVTVVLKQLHGSSHLLGAFRLSTTNAATGELMALPQEIDAALSVPPAERTPEQLLTLVARAFEDNTSAQLTKLPPVSRVYAAGTTVEIPIGNGKYQTGKISSPKIVNLLQRGDIDKPQQSVAPGALSVLDSLPARFSLSSAAESERRAALANWITHPDNVLTWRSVVNRVWHYHFGRGLCATPSDFGRMGDKPSHPELIDWLAVWFRDQSGQSLKQLHRLIVTSQTYQQCSQPSEQAQQVDSDNRLLWRQNCLRLDADAFRDSVLVVAGQLDASVGGPSIQQFKQSPGPQSTPVLDYTLYDWSSPGANRRSIYRYVWRGIPDPLMNSLDFPDLGLLSPTRGVSASPLQSLSLLNNPFVLHFTQAMADEIKTESPELVEQVRQAVRRVFCRNPEAAELELMVQYAGRHGVAALCRMLLNSNEFLFVP
jgi:Protein of unknown function (DUF1553)/Protein of unknown function (DUF1549)/Planctomycete cytochrome C